MKGPNIVRLGLAITILLLPFALLTASANAAPPMHGTPTPIPAPTLSPQKLMSRETAPQPVAPAIIVQQQQKQDQQTITIVQPAKAVAPVVVVIRESQAQPVVAVAPAANLPSVRITAPSAGDGGLK